MRLSLILALAILSILSVGAALNEGATDEEILSYARGVIDADYYHSGKMFASIYNNWSFDIEVHPSSYDDLTSIGYATWNGARVADKVCSEYPGRFNETSVWIYGEDGDRFFGYILLNQTGVEYYIK